MHTAPVMALAIKGWAQRMGPVTEHPATGKKAIGQTAEVSIALPF